MKGVQQMKGGTVICITVDADAVPPDDVPKGEACHEYDTEVAYVNISFIYLMYNIYQKREYNEMFGP